MSNSITLKSEPPIACEVKMPYIIILNIKTGSLFNFFLFCICRNSNQNNKKKERKYAISSSTFLEILNNQSVSHICMDVI